MYTIPIKQMEKIKIRKGSYYYEKKLKEHMKQIKGED